MITEDYTTPTCGCGLHNGLRKALSTLQSNVNQLFENKKAPLSPSTLLEKCNKNATILLRDVRHFEQSGYDNNDIRSLACRTNELAGNVIGIPPEILESPEGQNVLCSTYLLASALKSLNPLQQRTWQELSEDVQQLFNAIVPYTMPPTRKEEKRLNYCSAINLPSNSFYLSFADDSLFHAKHIPEVGFGEVCFKLPDHPDVILCGTGKYPYAENIGKYALQTHSKIQEVFDVESLSSLINELEKYPSISRETTPQLKHQQALLEAEYLNRILASLGVPVDRPLVMAEKGEWTIFPTGEIRSVGKHASFEKGSEKLKKVSSAIRSFFDFEKKYGLILLHNATHPGAPSFKDLFVLRDEDHIFSDKLLSKLIFIEGAIEKRHREIKKYLEDIYPKHLVSEIFRNSMKENNEFEAVSAILSLLAEKKFLSFEDLLKGSDAALEVLQAVMHTPHLHENFKEIPWHKFADRNELLIYLHLNRHVNQDEERPAATPESIYQGAYSIIEHIPQEGHPIPVDKSFEMIAEDDIRMRKQLKQLVIEHLLDEFLKDPKKSLQKTLQELIDQHCEKLSDIAKTDVKLQIPNINDINMEGKRVKPFSKSRLINTGDYFFKIFWTSFVEELNSMVFPKKITGTILDKITLLRAANVMANGDSVKKEIVIKTLYDVLHPHMLAYEKKRVGGEVLQRIQNHLK